MSLSPTNERTFNVRNVLTQADLEYIQLRKKIGQPKYPIFSHQQHIFLSSSTHCSSVYYSLPVTRDAHQNFKHDTQHHYTKPNICILFKGRSDTRGTEQNDGMCFNGMHFFQ